MTKTTTIFFNKFARYFGLQHKPSFGRAERKKSGKTLVVLAILFFATSAIRISLPSTFCILNNLLIQLYKRSGTTHQFVAVVLQILIIFVTIILYKQKNKTSKKKKNDRNKQNAV